MCQIVSNDKAWTCSYFRTVWWHQRCSMLWPSKNAPILVYLIILSHGRSQLWRATSTIWHGPFSGILFPASSTKRYDDGRTDRQDYGHPLNSGDFLDYSTLRISSIAVSIRHHTLAKWSWGRTQEVSCIALECFWSSKFCKCGRTTEVHVLFWIAR